MIKKLLFTILFLNFSFKAFANCSANIIDFYVGEKGGVVFEIQQILDGNILVPNDKKTVMPSQLKGLTKAQILNRLEAEIDRQCKNLIYQEYKKNKEDPKVESLKQKSTNLLDVLQNHRADILGVSVSRIFVDVQLDTDDDNFFDTKWSIKSDGTKTTSLIDPVVPVGN